MRCTCAAQVKLHYFYEGRGIPKEIIFSIRIEVLRFFRFISNEIEAF